MELRKESIGKFLIENRFQVKLRILSSYLNLFEFVKIQMSSTN